ncbi:PREDICTED: endonuclease domain-containing 1 protein-like [Thamnophis sirtalis]|uniref:Endonuclease domain-containing 1 protein-like n=1 Tax=Thamnophis sirtalis TaxID=35019 RepID=A0A6I9XX11_9SAUR|nr:PREDICTED: endonuclease domain-containing 1 protein-like [Thamnophis sirtalis]
MAMLLLWILSLAASFLLPATGEVVSSFQHCSQFFFNGNPPSNLVPLNPARICQYYMGSYRFATMYDKDGHIPLFSAYKYYPGPGATQMDWKIEPQLAQPWDHERRSMEPEGTCRIDPLLLAKSQAVWSDYVNAIQYNKGQLAPVSHQPDENFKSATYTFTNIVPQYQELINGKWAEFLSTMRQNTAECSETYVIVGVVPGDEFISGGRVNKPSHMWAAVCCLTKNDKKKSFGVIAENNQDKVEWAILKDLESKLNHKYGKKGIDLFNGDCY